MMYAISAFVSSWKDSRVVCDPWVCF